MEIVKSTDKHPTQIGTDYGMKVLVVDSGLN